MRRRGRTVVALTCSLGLVAGLAATHGPSAVAAARPERSESTQTIAPGLTLTRISDPDGPWIVRVLTVDPSKPVTIDIATAGGSIGAYARTSSIGGAHGALAAINGDFTVAPGRPLHPFAEDGTLRELGLQNGASFAISQDETGLFIDDQRVHVGGRNLGTTRRFDVVEWNTGDPKGGSIVGFTPYGGSAERPPGDACSVRLKPASKMRRGTVSGVVRDYKVIRRRCRPAAMGVRTRTVVLSSNTSGAGAAALKEMKRGQVVRLSWTFGWPDVMDSVGGMPLLVRGGTNVAHTCSSYFCSRNPRTGIGVTADGHVLLVTVDGRKTSSVGMTLIGFANYMIGLGAVRAVNLDGGGGSTMWVQGQGIVNDPSDSSGERAVTNAVLVLPGPDAAEPPLGLFGAPGHGTARLAPIPVSDAAARRAMRLAYADAGSTGGLLRALASGRL
jgi:Phosphodiester glycosidase